MMAKIMIEIFGEKLKRPEPNEVSSLPSPSDLKHKILIKGKRLAKGAMENIEEEELDDDEDPDDTEQYEGEDAGKRSSNYNDTRSSEDRERERVDMARKIGRKMSNNSATTTDQKSSKKKPHYKTHPDLSCINYLGTSKVKSFDREVSAAIPADMMASYGESKVLKVTKTVGNIVADGWIEHNRDHLSRIYP